MRNGKKIAVNFYIGLMLWFSCNNLFGQIKDTTQFNSYLSSFKIEEACKSVSEHSTKPTIIKITFAKLSEIKTVKELLLDIPEMCEVLCVFFSIKGTDDKAFEFRNIGNTIVYSDKLRGFKYILIDDLVTTCPTLHKANYKIVLE